MTIQIEDQEHFNKVVEFACNTGRAEELFKRLLYLHGYADDEQTGACVVHLGYDYAPASFSLYWEWKDKQRGMNGGLIFHGAHDGWGSGSGPTFSVCVEPTDGWSVHT